MPPAIKQGTGEQVLQVITVSDITSQITGNSIPLATSPFSSQVERVYESFFFLSPKYGFFFIYHTLHFHTNCD